MAMAGIPWWTADIGGFHGGNIHDPAFHELLARWFEFATYLPVMRLHGDRDPTTKRRSAKTGAACASRARRTKSGRIPLRAVRHGRAYPPPRRDARLPPRRHEEGARGRRARHPSPLLLLPEGQELLGGARGILLGEKLLVCPVLEANVRERKSISPQAPIGWQKTALSIRAAQRRPSPPPSSASLYSERYNCKSLRVLRRLFFHINFKSYFLTERSVASPPSEKKEMPRSPSSA